MNYGDTRSLHEGQEDLHRRDAARTYVARTYLDSMRYGVSPGLLVRLGHAHAGHRHDQPEQPRDQRGGFAFLTLQSWMVGKSWLGCKVKSKVTTCRLRARDGSVTAVRWRSKAKSYKVPKGVTAIHLLNGSVQPVVRGQKIRLTPQPVFMTGRKP